MKRTNLYNLAVINPTLSKQWHPVKNGLLTAYDVTPNSQKKVWWVCKKGHVWQALVSNRNKGVGCPYCIGKKVNKDNCLQTINPNIAREWHPTKNGNLSPKDFTTGSGIIIWWKCKEGHLWQASIAKRSSGRGCPYCSNKKVNKDNCLQTINPKLAKEWHPTKNDYLSPKDVTANSGKKVWWLCKKGHVWQAVITNRNKGIGCPYCHNKKVNEENCLQTINPVLAKEWHPIKNGKLTPKDVTLGSNKSVWWLCKKGHEWNTIIYNRKKGYGCPYCSGRKVNDDNCLQTINSKLAKEWHPTKNGKLSPKVILPNSNKKTWWICKRGHEWKAVVASRNNGRGCPYCSSNTSLMELRIYSEMKFLFKNAKHRIKLFNKECDIFIPNYNIVIEYDGLYWHTNKFLKDKEKTKHLQNRDFLVIRIREKGLAKVTNHDIIYSNTDNQLQLIKNILIIISSQIKIDLKHKKKIELYLKKKTLSNEKEFIKLYELLPSPSIENSLFFLNKILAKEWHPTKNGKLTPKDVSTHSGKKVWWLCKKGHEWNAIINNRNKGYGCPYCGGQKVHDDNCLQTINPILAKEWHPTKNGKLTPKDITANTNRKVWWTCKKGHEWLTSISQRNYGSGCPYCSGHKVSKDNCLQTINPKLAKEWHPSKNGSLTSYNVSYGSSKKVWWLCKKGHEWKVAVNDRNSGTGCPYCSNKKVNKDNCLQTINPKLAKEWHPTKNKNLTPDDVTTGSNKKVWWLCKRGHEWKAVVYSRSIGQGCPYCSGHKVSKDRCNTLQIS